MSKLVQISKSKYRSIVSDVLPYERPIFFSNRFFARFLKRYGICVQDGRLVATKNKCEGLDSLLLLLGGSKNDARPCFQYNITKEDHKEGRCLTIVHPFHQVQMVEFYDKYKSLMVDFCMRSSFSIRFPYKIATCKKEKKGFPHLISDIDEGINTRESIKHFFAYKYYNNINQFYDDYRFLRAEKRFPYLVKLDLQKCFESIRPESLSIAMFGVDLELCQGSMADVFCNLQQSFLSNDEGIVIGPEFSRIFAEIILQRVDNQLERSLTNGFNLEKTKDYQFFRYVDDGFFFCNNEKMAKIFIKEYESCLKPYNMQISQKKTKYFAQRPFLESITCIKQSLTGLIDDIFESRLETFKGFKRIQNDYYETPTSIDYKSFVKAIRSIIGTAGINQDGKPNVLYKDIMSFMLGLIQKRLNILLKQFNDLYKQYSEAVYTGYISEKGRSIKNQYENEFLIFLINLVEILFYLLSCDLRMTTSIKIVSLISKLQLYVRGYYKFDDGTISTKFDAVYISMLDKRISDETQSFLDCSTPKDHNTMEILNILELQKLMQIPCQISEESLKKFLHHEKGSIRYNFFIVFELLHFIKYSSSYEWLKTDIYSWIDSTLEKLTNPKESDTEAVLTAFELFCCPWANKDIKHKWANKLFGQQSATVLQFTSKQKDIFIRWHNYNVNEELQHINSTEVY